MKKVYIRFTTILISFLFMGTVYATDEGVNIHGFISQGYFKTTRNNNYIADSSDGTFQFNEMGINFGHQPMDKLMIAIQFCARDFGSVGNDEIQVDYAVADYRFRDYFGVRAGRMKNPMGIYSQTRDIDMLRTCILLPYSVYDESFRDSLTYLNGAGIYGDLNTANWGSLSYQLIAGTNNVAPDSAMGDFIGTNVYKANSIDFKPAHSLALLYSDPTGYFRLSGTYLWVEMGVTAYLKSGNYLGLPEGTFMSAEYRNLQVFTSSIEFTWNNLTLSYEWKYLKLRNVDGYLNDFLVVAQPMDLSGGYLMIDYQLTEQLSACIYYDEFYFNRYDRSGNTGTIGLEKIQHWMKKTSFALKYDINSNWIVKAQADYVDGAAGLLIIHNDEFEKHWWMYAIKLSYNF